MNDSQQLREQMWDLVYGLLEADESQALIARIKSDPTAARLYAEVRLQADLVGYAARVEDSSFVVKADSGADKPTPARCEKPAAKSDPRRTTNGSRSGAWLTLGAATALVTLLAVGQFWPRFEEQQLAAHYVVTEVEAPRSMPGGLRNSVAFHTTTLDGEGQAATVDFTIRGRGGRELLRQQVTTNDIGRAAVGIPGSALEPGVRLEVLDVELVASSKLNAEAERLTETAAAKEFKRKVFAAVAADLPVQAEPQMAYILLEEPLASSDKPVNASVWNFFTFSGKPAPPQTAEQVAQSIPGLAITDDSGAAAPAANELGILKGVVQNQAPSGAQAGRGFGLAYQSNPGATRGAMPAEAAPAQQQNLRAAPRQADILAESAANAPADVRLQREGESANQEANKQLKDLAQTTDGFGRYRASIAEEGRAGAATNLAPGEPIHVEIPAEYAGKQLVVAANARGVNVANTNVDANNTQLSAAQRNLGQLANNIQLDLPPEADGPIEVALLDPASSPPQVVSRNYVYREPTRKLQIDVGNLKERFAPGERVQVTLQVSDEAGRPAADTRLGVRLWNEELVQQNAEHPLLLAEALQAGLPGAIVSQSAASQSAASQLAAIPVPAIELLAKDNDTDRAALAELGDKVSAVKDVEKKAIAGGTGGAASRPHVEMEKLRLSRAEGQSATLATPAPAAPRGQPFADTLSADAPSPPDTEWFLNWGAVASQEPVELASNRDVVQAAYDSAASAGREGRQQILRAIGVAAIAGSVALLFLVVVLAGRRRARKLLIIAPALAVSLASLLVGVAWIGWLPPARWERQIAMTTAAAPAAAEPAVGSSAEGMWLAAPALTPYDSDALPPTIPLSEPAAAAGAAGSTSSATAPRDFAEAKPAEPAAPLAAAPASGELGQRQAGQGGQGRPGGGGGAAPLSGGRDRLTFEQLERKYAAPPKAAKETARPEDAKSAAGIAGAVVQSAPALAPAAPAASTFGGQPSAARADGGVATDGKNEAEGAGRAGVRFSRDNQLGGFGAKADDVRAIVNPPTAGATPPKAPASLYFNPNLQTNNQGIATIEFTMPPVDSQYRLLIDALGQGRIGSRQQLIIGQGEAPK